MFASEEQDDFLKKFWELESVPSAKSLTREEISCEEIYINNLKILEDGRCLKSQILTFEELSTLTTQIEACLNSRPICPLSSDSDDFNPRTPGHFLIGRPLIALPESNDDDVPIKYLDRWSLNQKIKNVFWKRWNREYLNNLQQRLKWQKSSPNIKEGDLILLKDTISPPAMYWSLGRITKVFPGAGGKVRVVEFDVVAQANGWNVRDRASFLAAAFRGPSVEVLQTITEQLRLDFNTLIGVPIWRRTLPTTSCGEVQE
ncbi:hypothetical protein LAZ67_10001726 [Cordylochernes scorpioides]|uniref:DUF5641 domain-containing protein n=1 Tax=Cordylochernes scorpioides TaxID=51811 RepID=A0ABY6KW36_9ARAC|nr:hypothetical protein LAZ67_10001726 [Cordylochernes scorpioides]